MLLLLMILGVILLLLPFLIVFIKNKGRDYFKDTYEDYLIFPILGLVVFGVSLTAFVINLGNYESIKYNEERIEMLEQHNQEIETRIRVIVENYLEYEGNIYDFENEDITTLFVLIPQLSSNVVVQREMELYISNSDEIKSLKLRTINRKVLAWWLWFGNE